MIPRVIHQVWVGPPLPAHLAAYAESWRKMHPAWEYRLWGDDDLRWLVNQDLYDRAEEISPRNVGQFRSNIARLEILLHHGGVYIDSDMEPVRPIDPLVEGVDAFFPYHRPPHIKPQYISTGLIGATPGHIAFRSLVDGIPESVATNIGLRSIHTTGVRYVTRRLAAEGLLDTVTLYPSIYFIPYQDWEIKRMGGLPASKFRKSYAVHRWHNALSGGWKGDAA